MPLEAHEDIAKAIPSEKWDPENGEVSPSLFKGSRGSVSRLSITPLEETWDLFRLHVEKPPERKLERIGEINVGILQEIGENFEANPTQLSVEPDPLDGYESHAIIPEKVSRGLAVQIVIALKLHKRDQIF